MSATDSNGEPIVTFGLVRDRIKAILARKLPTLAGRILVDRQWPTGADAQPFLLIESGTERKVLTVAGGSPEYDVTATIGVSIRVQARGEAAALTQLDALERLVCVALLAQPDALTDLPGFDRVGAIIRNSSMSTEGDRIEAQTSLAFDCLWTEFYPPATPDALLRLHVRLDAIEPFDPTGPYPPLDDFPAPAEPPRTSGPDGRPEIGANIDLPA